MRRDLCEGRRLSRAWGMALGVHLCLWSVCHTWESVEARGECQIPWGWHSRQLWAALLVLGTELWSCGRAASALHHGVISPAPRTAFFREHNSLKVPTSYCMHWESVLLAFLDKVKELPFSSGWERLNGQRNVPKVTQLVCCLSSVQITGAGSAAQWVQCDNTPNSFTVSVFCVLVMTNLGVYKTVQHPVPITMWHPCHSLGAQTHSCFPCQGTHMSLTTPFVRLPDSACGYSGVRNLYRLLR